MRIPPIGSIPEILTALRARLRRELARLRERLALLLEWILRRIGPLLKRIGQRTGPMLTRIGARVRPLPGQIGQHIGPMLTGIRTRVRPLVGRIGRLLGPLRERARPTVNRIREQTRRLGRAAQRRAHREAGRIRVDAERIRRGEHSFWGSRLSLLTGLCLALAGTLGAAAFSLGSGTASRGFDGTVVAGEADSASPVTLELAATRDFVIPGGAPKLTWPSSGRAAIEVEGMGLLGHDGSMTARAAIASITKTMTAYVVLKDHPLGAQDSGPTIVVSAAMASLYGQAIDRDESALPLRAGERLTERQALEGMMLASAGDFADLLAEWDRGSIGAFAAAMNAQARALGMTSGTLYTDPTGLAASTVSTMADQLKLAEAVQRVPVLASIVNERSAQVPVAGTVQNVNRDLGSLGIDGIKTGTTAAAGSCLLFSARLVVGGRTLTLLGIVLGMPGSSGVPWTALKAAELLVQSAESSLRSATAAAPGAAIATLEQDGSRVASLGVTEPVTVVGWPGLGFRLTVQGGTSAPHLIVTQTGGSAAPLTAALSRLPAAAASPEKSSTPAQSATPASR